ncbi:MAG TPA: hypothetical protein VGH15_06815 [Caulobacteraceae bacterium]
MKSAALVASALMVTLALGGRASALDLSLRCAGVATAPKSTSEYVYAAGHTSPSWVTTDSVGASPQVVLFELGAAGARIKLPGALVPLVNSGGNAGWWNVLDLRVGESAITGKVRINPLSQPAITLDRMTGDIAVGGGDRAFRGNCATVQSERKF